MFVFSLLLIPIVATLIMLIFFNKKMAIWEYALTFFVPLFIIFICKWISIASQDADFEYWNTYLVSAEYIEPWSTWHHRTCTRTSRVGKTTVTTSYDCSHCENHSESYIAYDNLGKSHTISEFMFNQLCKRWNNRDFVDLHRSIKYHFGCGKDGDKYVTKFDNKFFNIIPVTETHIYQNKVQSSNSIFNFKTIDTSEVRMYGLYNYTKKFDKFSYNPIYGDNNVLANDKLRQWNAWLGSVKQVNMNILIFKNKTIDAAEYQKAYWKGGNKNEFILCIGVDNSNVIKWTKVISWTEVEMLKIKVERSVAEMKYDLPAITDTMATYVNKMYVRKSFSDFKYITVEPTKTAYIISFIIVLLFTTGLCIFSIKNEFDND